MNHLPYSVRLASRSRSAFTTARLFTGPRRLPCSVPHRRITSRGGLQPAALRDPAPPNAAPEDTEHGDGDEEIYSDEISDFGAYSVILPEEPFVFGTSHITPRSVPSHIPHPPYIGAPPNVPHHGDPYTGDGRILLGEAEERRLRSAAQLAKQALDYAGSLVEVRFDIFYK